MTALRSACLATTALVLLFVACTGDGGPTDPSKVPSVTETVDVPNLFAQEEALAVGPGALQVASLVALVEIRKIRVTVYLVPSGKVFFQQVYDVNPAAASWSISYNVPLGEKVRLVIEQMSVTNGVPKVEYSGRSEPYIATNCGSSCPPSRIPAYYPGPADNLGATSVTVSPRTRTMSMGQTAQLSATVAPTGPTYAPRWLSLNALVTSVNATGVVTARSAGVARIVVNVGPRSDTATITVHESTLQRNAGDAQTAAAGSAVSVAPAVIVRSAAGSPLPGVSVVFGVTSGGGSVTGANATTDAQGIATVGKWTLGTTAGTNTLTATLAAANISATFTATGAPGAPTRIAVQAGEAQTAEAGSAVTVAPSVVVQDANNNPVADVVVTFEATTGGGNVTGANTATDAQGIATVGSWTLGQTVGTQTLTARAGSASATISATASAPDTCVPHTYTLGSTVTAAWTEGDCVVASGSGRRYDRHEFSIAEQTAFRAAITGPTGRRVSLRRAGTQDYVQLMASEELMPAASNPLEVRYVLAPGSYVFEIANPDAATLGSYTLATSLDAAVTCNPIVFVTTGVTISEQISPATDCTDRFGGNEDRFVILPEAGVRVDLTLATTAFAPVLVFRDGQGATSPALSSDLRTTVGPTARTAYTTTFSGFHEIVVGHANAGGSGPYTLTVGTGNPANTCEPIPSSAGTRLAVWESTDCAANGRLEDSYPFTVISPLAFRSTLASQATQKSMALVLGANKGWSFIRGIAGDLVVNWFLAPGHYELVAGAPSGAAGSTYTITATPTTGDLGCARNATSGNVSFPNQTLGGSDCTFNSRFEDRVVLGVEAGQEIVVEMTAAVAPAALIQANILDPATGAGTLLAHARRDDAGGVTATWRAETTGVYIVIFSTDAQNVSGTYSGSISVR